MARAAATWPPASVQVHGPTGTDSRMLSIAKKGAKLPRYSPKATAIAAMPPDMTIRKAAHPKRKPQKRP
jgi:hypothetical protein